MSTLYLEVSGNPEDGTTDMLTDVEIGGVAREATSRARNRKISLVLVVTAVIGCASFAAIKNQKVLPVPTNYRVGSHPAFVNYEALPSLLNENLPLCHSDIVEATCLILSNFTDAHKVMPKNIASLIDATPASFKSFLDKVGVWIWFDKIDCQELCEKTVASFEPGKLPTTSNTGCISETDCSLHLGDVLNQELWAPGAGGYLEGDTFELPVFPPKNVSKPKPVKDREFKEIQKAVAEFFGISPLLEVITHTEPAPPGRKLAAAVSVQEITTDIVEVRSHVAKAIERLNVHDEHDQKVFQRWFGIDNAERIAEVKRVLNGVASRIDTANIAWELRSECPSDLIYAFTYNPEKLDSYGRAMIFVCPLYAGQDKLIKLETIFHEITHLTDMSTADWAYGYKKNQALAKDCKEDGAASVACTQSLDNADSFTYYLFDINGDYKGKDSIKDRIKAGFDKYKDKLYTAQNSAKECVTGSKKECAKKALAYAKKNPINTTIATITSLVVLILCFVCCCGGLIWKKKKDNQRY
jgi:hypothetical protein